MLIVYRRCVHVDRERSKSWPLSLDPLPTSQQNLWQQKAEAFTASNLKAKLLLEVAKVA